MGIAARSAEKGNVYGQKEPKVLVRIVGQRRWRPRSTRSNGCVAAPAGRCIPRKSRKE
jgi:hypothetical protein